MESALQLACLGDRASPLVVTLFGPDTGHIPDTESSGGFCTRVGRYRISRFPQYDHSLQVHNIYSMLQFNVTKVHPASQVRKVCTPIRVNSVDIDNERTLHLRQKYAYLFALRNKSNLIGYVFSHKNYDFKSDYPEYTVIRHLVAISCYKEPVPLIARSVRSLPDQTEAKRITMVISFEQKTPDVDKKIEDLSKIFCNSFERLLFTVHPFGEPNEIPGKCSNANYGLRESVRVLQQEMGQFFEPTKIVVTTCDADSNFHPKYIEALTSRFLKEEKPDTLVFQPPLLYNWGLDGTSFVTRVTGLLRSTLMMGNLIPFNINTMSIFSFSLKLCMNGNYVHPAYQMDDMICLIRWMGVTGQRLRIPLIPVPVISGPTSGSTIELELSEWTRQARRWTIGAGEVFHYYAIKASRIPFLPAFSWGVCFLIYYGILLCSASLYSVSASVSMAVLIKSVPGCITYTMYGLAGLQQLCFFVVFVLDVAGPKLMNVEEHISFVRNVLHWILTPFVLIGYSLVELYALHEVMIRGKEVCKHGASKKKALQAT